MKGKMPTPQFVCKEGLVIPGVGVVPFIMLDVQRSSDDEFIINPPMMLAAFGNVPHFDKLCNPKIFKMFINDEFGMDFEFNVTGWGVHVYISSKHPFDKCEQISTCGDYKYGRWIRIGRENASAGNAYNVAAGYIINILQDQEDLFENKNDVKMEFFVDFYKKNIPIKKYTIEELRKLGDEGYSVVEYSNGSRINMPVHLWIDLYAIPIPCRKYNYSSNGITYKDGYQLVKQRITLINN